MQDVCRNVGWEVQGSRGVVCGVEMGVTAAASEHEKLERTIESLSPCETPPTTDPETEIAKRLRGACTRTPARVGARAFQL